MATKERPRSIRADRGQGSADESGGLRGDPSDTQATDESQALVVEDDERMSTASWFGKVPGRAFLDNRLTCADIAILAALGWRADHLGQCFPSFDKLAEDSKVSRSSVARRLKLLVSLGYLTVRRRTKKDGGLTSNMYSIIATPGSDWHGGSATVTPPQCQGDTLTIPNELSPKNKEQEYPDDFTEFWEAYPKKTGKDDAFRAWKKIAPDFMAAFEIMDALGQWKKCSRWTRDEGTYVKDPATWLNGKFWREDPPVEKRSNAYGR